MKVHFVGIAGGSGSGKSTLCFNLLDKYPKKISILHFDDYQKKRVEVPQVNGMANWDHPDAIRWEKLIEDLGDLRDGKPITVATMNERDNPQYGSARERIEIEVAPKPIVLVEGYLALYHPEVRAFFDLMIYLDASHDERMARRTKSLNPDYVAQILTPMHKEYVEPTKHHAHVIDVSGKTAAQVLEEAETLIIKPHGDHGA
ncbi:MAG TPA: hypothetical protein VMA75_00425 [Candidatus Paceibacterota bacterium]|nr:hypothetical protein [Candidatus Paceibacterota bacterium]